MYPMVSVQYRLQALTSNGTGIRQPE